MHNKEVSTAYVIQEELTFQESAPKLTTPDTYYLVFLIQEGCGYFQVESDYYKIEKGNLVFLVPGLPYRFLAAQETFPIKCVCLRFHPDFMHLLYSTWPLFRQDRLYIWSTSSNDFLNIWSYHINREALIPLDGYKKEAFFYGSILCVFSQWQHLVENAKVKRPSHKNKALGDAVARYLDEHYMDNITISIIAKTFLVSESTVTKAIRSCFNMSFKQYLTDIRLKKGENLRKQGITFEEIAYMTGYESYSSFYRAFVKRYGSSPRNIEDLKKS